MTEAEDRAAQRLRGKVRKIIEQHCKRFPQRDPSSEDSAPLREAIQKAFKGHLDEKSSSDLWFHMTDWAWELEFLLALYLEPAEFTPAEIRQGVQEFLLHAPTHIVQAARIAGWPVHSLPAMPSAPDADASV